MLRPVSTRHYLDFMRARGYTDAELLAGSGIDVASLDEPSYLIKQDEHQAFLENMLRLDGDRGLGLEIALHSEVSHYGILAYSGLSSLTLRYGMEQIWSKYGHAFGIMSRLHIRSSSADTSLVEILAPRPSEPLYRFSVEEALGILLKIGAPLVHISTPPFRSVRLSYPEPGYSRRYRDLLQCPVLFDADRTQVEFERNWLDLPFKTSDLELNHVCQERLDQVLRLAESGTPVTLRLRHLLLSRTSDMPTLEDAAREFSVSPRTLARQLQNEGRSYRHLTEELRKELAQSWLKSPEMTAKEVSYRLGFSDVGAFRRAFKSWTGCTIGEYCRVTSTAA